MHTSHREILLKLILIQLFRKEAETLNFFFKLCFERETGCEQGRGRERGRERIPSRLYAVSTEPDAGLGLMEWEIMTCAETKSRTLN